MAGAGLRDPQRCLGAAAQPPHRKASSILADFGLLQASKCLQKQAKQLRQAPQRLRKLAEARRRRPPAGLRSAGGREERRLPERGGLLHGPAARRRASGLRCWRTSAPGLTYRSWRCWTRWWGSSRCCWWRTRHELRWVGRLRRWLERASLEWKHGLRWPVSSGSSPPVHGLHWILGWRHCVEAFILNSWVSRGQMHRVDAFLVPGIFNLPAPGWHLKASLACQELLNHHL